MAAQTFIMVSGTRRPILFAKVMHLGALRMLRTAKVMSGGTVRLVANFLSAVSVTAPDLLGQLANPSSPSTATPSGGLGPYTYVWTVLFGDVTAITPTNASTAFLVQGFGVSASARVIVTDSLGSTASHDIAIYFV